MGPAHARWAPTEMNEMSDAQLRGLLLHAWQPAPGGHAASRLPLLATFITNATLFRVRNLLVPIAPANGLTTALGYALAALTGAPQPACECTAHHIGNAASSCITNYDLRRKALGKPSIVSKTKWMRERQKRDDEALFVDASWGGTPQRRAVLNLRRHLLGTCHGGGVISIGNARSHTMLMRKDCSASTVRIF